MKEKILKYSKNWIVLIIALLVLAFVVILLSIISYNKKIDENANKQNNYQIENKVVEMPGTKIIKNDKLNEEHCYKDLCVSNVIFYENKDGGRVEATIKNNSNITKSGYLKMNVNNTYLVLVYKNIDSMESKKIVSRYREIVFDSIDDYTLEGLTKKERSSIVK